MTVSPPGKGANSDPKIRLMRSATTHATRTYGLGGILKHRRAPKPITLPKLKCLKENETGDE